VFLRQRQRSAFCLTRLRVDIVLNNLVSLRSSTRRRSRFVDGTPSPRWCTRGTSLPLSLVTLGADQQVHCAAYNVGTRSNNLTVAEIAQSVVDVVPGAKLLITGETGSDPRSYRVDFSSFPRCTGLRSGVDDTRWCGQLYKEYISAGLTGDDLFKKFTRLPHLETLRATGVLDASMRRITTDA
jgi:hypothetical protein